MYQAEPGRQGTENEVFKEMLRMYKGECWELKIDGQARGTFLRALSQAKQSAFYSQVIGNCKQRNIRRAVC